MIHSTQKERFKLNQLSKCESIEEQKPSVFSDLLDQIAKSNWQKYLFIPHVFANLSTIIVCFLFYGIYILLDEYLHTILISILVGTSLKPIKNAFVSKLLRIIYQKDSQDEVYQPLLTKLQKNFLFNNDKLKYEQEQKQVTSPEVKKLNISVPPSPKIKEQKNKDKRRELKKKRTYSDFSQIRTSQVLRDHENQSEWNQVKKQSLTIKQLILRILWQLIVVVSLIFIFYMIQATTGLVILFVMLVGEYLLGVLYQIFNPFIKLGLRAAFWFLETFVDKPKLQKLLSKFLSVLFIVLVIALIVLTICSSVFLIYKDGMNIKQGINEDFIKNDFLNFSTHIHRIVQFVGGLNVTQQIKALMPQQKYNYKYQTLIKKCTNKFQEHTVLKLIPEIIKQNFCNFYTKYDYQTLQTYLPIMKQILIIIGSILGLSFSSVYGLFNFVFLAWFKLIMFLSTTYYITEEFNIGSLSSLMGKFINVTKSRTNKITILFFEIKNVMFGSLKISFLHFMLSWIIFDYFNITNFNFILSLFLGFMALVPIYHPFIGASVVFFCSWTYKEDSSKLFYLILSIVYFGLSYTIFSLSYSKISMPNLITNLSVILGIYSFGALGVVYGPIIVIILNGILNEFKKF